MNDKKDAAVATLENLGYTHEGGNLWKPPLGKAPDFNLLDTLHARIASLEAQLSERQAAPEGWRLVPESPTEEMIKAGDAKTWVLPCNYCWSAMLSAAPPPPQREPLKGVQ